MSERDRALKVVGANARDALLASVLRWLLDYCALLLALAAVGAEPRPSLVLLAFTGAQMLALIPVTPGGLGFVEAGLAGLLALAGVNAADAALATLAYRFVSYWLPLPAGGVAVLLHRRMTTKGRRYAGMTAAPRRASARKIVALLGSALLVAVYRRVFAIEQRPSWPPPADAVTSAGAEAATQALAARGGARPHGAALEFAWSTAATIEPWVEGANFFPRIFADVEAARSSVHILMFGWREGEVGMRMAALLEQKLAEGVEVRVIVDALGSRPYRAGARRCSRALPRRGRRSSSTTCSRPTVTGSFPITSTSTGARTRSAAPTIASCTWSTERSRGRAVRASRTTFRTAASTT